MGNKRGHLVQTRKKTEEKIDGNNSGPGLTHDVKERPQPAHRPSRAKRVRGNVRESQDIDLDNYE